MELLNTLYNLMGLVFVLGTIISMGLSLTIKQITEPLRNSRFVIVALLANFVAPPILALLLTRVFNLDEPLAVGLLLVSLAAGAPALPKTAVFAKVDTAAATGLMVLLVVATIIIMPIALPLLLTGISVTFWDIAAGLVYLILIPLAVSLFVRARYPELAASAQPVGAPNPKPHRRDYPGHHRRIIISRRFEGAFPGFSGWIMRLQKPSVKLD